MEEEFTVEEQEQLAKFREYLKEVKEMNRKILYEGQDNSLIKKYEGKLIQYHVMILSVLKGVTEAASPLKEILTPSPDENLKRRIIFFSTRDLITYPLTPDPVRVNEQANTKKLTS
jgi:hypothetical protein